MKIAISLVIASVLILVSSGVGTPLIHHVAASSSPETHFGFWVSEGDMWGGGGLNWTPQQFFNNYFLTAPYPSGLLWIAAPSQISGYMNTKDASWFPQVASMADQYPNIKIIVEVFINLTDPAQVSEFQTYVNSLKPYSSVYGFQYEPEYFGDTAAEETTFYNIVTGAGFVDACNTRQCPITFPNNQVLGYSQYPYFNDAIVTSLPSPNYIGIGYGETGAPCCGQPDPIWTQTSVTSIVDSSAPAPFTLIYAEMGGTGQPFNFLWSWSTLRNWIWNDPNYNANYVLSTASATQASTQSATTTSTSTYTSTQGTTSTSSSLSYSASSSSDPPLSISNSNPSVGNWVEITGSGLPPSTSVEVSVFNNSTNSYATYLYPGSTSSIGTLSFWMQVTSAMTGTDTAFIYAPASSSVPLSVLEFSTETITTTTSSTTTSSTSNTTSATSTSNSATAGTTSSSSYSATPSQTGSTTTSSSTSSTVSATSEFYSSSSSSTISSIPKTGGHDGQSNAQNNQQVSGQGNAYGLMKKNTNSTTTFSSYSLSDIKGGISSILSPSNFLTMLSSAPNPAAAYGFAAYETTLVGGLSIVLGSIYRGKKDQVQSVHVWRW